jgi:erythromycin esterase-like protein
MPGLQHRLQQTRSIIAGSAKGNAMLEPSMIAALRAQALPLLPGDNLDAVMEQIGNAKLVLLGEASHGTREFYRLRADISKRLIVDCGFDAIAVEADWPDALQVSRYIGPSGEDSNANQALSGFQRFPQWMWRNTETVAFIEWLRQHNASLPPATLQGGAQRIGFFGIDLYSLHKSIDSVLHYLDLNDAAAAAQARERYGCFDQFGADPQHYGYATSFGMKPGCTQQVIEQLIDLNVAAAAQLSKSVGGASDTLASDILSDELFYAQQNARVVKNAESYYRAMFQSRDISWNMRDLHMAETLDALRQHISLRKGSPAKIAVWAHNSHLGDARATQMSERGELNLGQLVRERYPAQESFLLGFTTCSGTVTAASDWGAPAQKKKLVPARADSIEGLFHATGLARFLLPLRAGDSVLAHVGLRYLERAIGVIYRPESERQSHYFHADVAHQFDAVIHVDHSSALQPLERSVHWAPSEEAETYPFGV